jgi:hypothetical protein
VLGDAPPMTVIDRAAAPAGPPVEPPTGGLGTWRSAQPGRSDEVPVHRAADAARPEPDAPPRSADPAAAPAPAPTPAAAAGTAPPPADLPPDLADQLYTKIVRRLRMDLLLDLERRGTRSP